MTLTLQCKLHVDRFCCPICSVVSKGIALVLMKKEGSQGNLDIQKKVAEDMGRDERPHPSELVRENVIQELTFY